MVCQRHQLDHMLIIYTLLQYLMNIVLDAKNS